MYLTVSTICATIQPPLSVQSRLALLQSPMRAYMRSAEHGTPSSGRSSKASTMGFSSACRCLTTSSSKVISPSGSKHQMIELSVAIFVRSPSTVSTFSARAM